MYEIYFSKKEKLGLIISFGILMGIHLITLNQHYMIYLSTDEFSQWAIAAHLNGVDWSQTMRDSGINYYSYFYALFLALIFKLVPNLVWMYRTALILNAFLASSTVFFSYFVCKHFIGDSRISLLLAVLSASYSAVILQSHYTWSETFLMVLFWVVLYLLIKILYSEPSYKLCFLFAVALSVGYMTHQRWVGILVSGCLIMLVLLLIKKISVYHFLTFLSIIGLAFCIHGEVKHYFLENVWLVDSASKVVLENDYASQIRKISYIFTLRGFLNTLQGFIGQLFYLGVSTFLVGYFGVYHLIKTAIMEIKTIIKGQTKSEKQVLDGAFCLFVLSAALLTFAISTIFMNKPNRLDQIVYGRYNEIVTGIILLFGFIEIQKKNNFKKSIGCFSIFGIFAAITYFYIHYNGNPEFRIEDFQAVCAVGIGIFRLYELPFWVMVMVVLGIAAIILTLFANRKKYIKGLGVVLLSGFFIFIGIATQFKTSISFEKRWYSLYELIDKTKERTDSPIYWMGETDLLQRQFTQYLLHKRTLESSEIDGTNIENSALVFSADISLLFEKYKLLGQKMGVFLFQKGGEDDGGADIPIDCFSTMVGMADREGGLESQGAAGALMYGPYWTLEPGKYTFSVELELLENVDEEVGKVDLSMKQDGEDRVEEYTLRKEVFDSEGKTIVKLTLNLEETADLFELRVWVNNNSILKVLSVQAEKQ